MKEQLIQTIEEAKHEQLALLEKLILTSSHSTDREGTNRVGQLLQQALSECNGSTSCHGHEICGDSIIFRSSAYTPNKPYILLLGHMDTVFPRESDFNYYREDHARAYGPGVCDMKGGLVTAVHLLIALQSSQLLDSIPLVFLCNGDEEIGSPHSTPLIKEYAKNCLCGLVFECGGMQGEIVTGRKGKAAYLLEVSGKAGHSAFSEENGKASAILELANKIIQLEELNAIRSGVVVNVGKINGGIASNVIAERAWAEIDTRFISADDGDFCHKKIKEITASTTVKDTVAQYSLTKSRYPMKQTEKNTALFNIYKKQADELGIATGMELRSGVSDANTLAECGKAVIDGLGPIGNHDHSDNEYIEKDTLLQRCKLATLTVVDIWDNYLNGRHCW